MRSEKLHLVNYVSGMIKDSDYVYFVSYMGLSVKAFGTLRAKLAANNATCHVIKNTLIRKAGAAAGIDAVANLPLTDGTAMVCGKGDASATAKTLVEFGKDFEQVAPKGGYFDGAAVSVADFKMLASLPTKEVLRAQLLGVLQAPARNVAMLLNAKTASILHVLNAYQDKIK